MKGKKTAQAEGAKPAQRGARVDQEEIVADFQKSIEVLRKENEQLSKKEKTIDTQLRQVEKELQSGHRLTRGDPDAWDQPASQPASHSPPPQSTTDNSCQIGQ